MMAAFARETLGPNWTLETLTNADAPPIITDDAGAARAVAALLRTFGAGHDPAEGVILSAFLDPGLAELRALLDVPVVGIAEAAMHEAGRHGRFAILSTTPDLDARMRDLAARYGEAERLAGILTIEGDPHRVMGDPALLLSTLRAMLADAATRLSVGAVIVGGGPLAQAARTLVAEADLPVVEPVPAAARALKARLAAGGIG